MRYESILSLPSPEAISAGLVSPVSSAQIIEKIAEIAHPVELHDGRVHIEWDVGSDGDAWDLRVMVEEVRMGVEALLNACLVWNRPTPIEES